MHLRCCNIKSWLFYIVPWFVHNQNASLKVNSNCYLLCCWHLPHFNHTDQAREHQNTAEQQHAVCERGSMSEREVSPHTTEFLLFFFVFLPKWWRHQWQIIKRLMLFFYDGVIDNNAKLLSCMSPPSLCCFFVCLFVCFEHWSCLCTPPSCWLLIFPSINRIVSLKSAVGKLMVCNGC